MKPKLGVAEKGTRTRALQGRDSGRLLSRAWNRERTGSGTRQGGRGLGARGARAPVGRGKGRLGASPLARLPCDSKRLLTAAPLQGRRGELGCH